MRLTKMIHKNETHKNDPQKCDSQNVPQNVPQK